MVRSTMFRRTSERATRSRLTPSCNGWMRRETCLNGRYAMRVVALVPWQFHLLSEVLRFRHPTYQNPWQTKAAQELMQFWYATIYLKGGRPSSFVPKISACCSQGADASRVTFEAADLESLAGSYDLVCCVDVLIHYPDEKLRDMIGHLGSLTTGQLIFSFAPRTPLLALLKKVGDFFPGPSKATRAYLHAEDEVVSILSELGFKVVRRSETRAKFYFSTVLQVERA
uniref:Magnesium-protoporphyrin IX methyltransferase C-terminal domain-containing protein n=1 Tax=Rhodosorus marinus TaxID=101924 RepID=A0A7S3E9L0_9RHOD|mmetsp:Transcript_16754/g.68564  ORF Transcript_16754/g.68564 Transcript_16754/m.68564 type:complete len:227 (+) Transcript_16754:394-1074(+)